MVRATFHTLATTAQVDPTTGVLRVSQSHTASGPVEISVVYYRAGYSPDDYASETDFQTRFILEESLAIKCPSIPLQLAGTKKIQEHLTQPGVLEHILQHNNDVDIGPSHVKALRDSWMEMWSLDGEEGYKRANDGHQHLVLKPQREGGGNNIYHTDIPQFLQTLPSKDREAWIAMKLIDVPQASNLLVRTGGMVVSPSGTVNELGIFGWSLFSDRVVGVMVKDASGGWLLRTKGSESKEGGIAVGISVLDTPVLV